MANITTDNIKAIVQSVIASATRHKPNLSVTDPNDPRFVVGADKVARQTDVTKMGKRLTTLEQYEDETNQIANNANNTANSAKTAANTASTKADNAYGNANAALSTANTAKSTAESALSTANTAKSTAESALSTANTAKSTAESALSTADTALNEAGRAVLTVDSALPKSGGTISGDVNFVGDILVLTTEGGVFCRTLNVRAAVRSVGGVLTFRAKENDEKECLVGRDSETDVFAPSTLRFIANGARKMVLKGMDVLKMRSANASFWDLYIDDDGQLLIADESGSEVHKYVTPAKLEEAMETVNEKTVNLSVDEDGNATLEWR